MDVRASPGTRSRVDGYVCPVLIEGIGTVVASELRGLSLLTEMDGRPGHHAVIPKRPCDCKKPSHHHDKLEALNSNDSNSALASRGGCLCS